ncbi:putative pectinesterase inhibitor domain-containing protein [Medicago truncatula]|uniref:Putative pectinesterase inhibitor domain-containing protein n=1 Tax=Medicago truncatula TaxID=3880 RepID=A2Q677_MEDTR|nr:hypothetical protein MtrDRAFT_AC173289g18v1 [Medicago truncatula]AES64956.1 hypothetical protein MTR_2g033670 [Medicago truncatula]RHN73033.1 putative pectinesterase inhibitor domain-containing protein [Medicago truncatula]
MRLKAALDNCIASYTKISKELVPQAQKCVDKSDYNGVKQSATTAGNNWLILVRRNAMAISPLGDSNQYVKNMCAITVSIVTKLPKSIHQTLTEVV